MNVRATAASEAELALSRQFAEAGRRLPGGKRWTLTREEAFRRFADQGLPGRRVESWHYTDLRNLMRQALPPVAPPRKSIFGGAKSLAPLYAGAARIVLVDGVFRPDLSDALAGLTARPLGEALRDGDESFAELLAPQTSPADPVMALNSAFMDRGVVLEAAAGAKLASPVELVHLSESGAPQAIYCRSLIRLGEGASLSVTERGTTDAGERQVNSVLVLNLGVGSYLDYVRIADQKTAAMRIESVLATLAAKARLTALTFVARASFLRRQCWLRFDGEGADAALAGVSLLRDDEHVDNTLVVEHAAAQCRSRENFRHVVDGGAAGVFQGKIVVAPGAQKTDGVMSSRCILLADGAAMYNKPELEIFADDVVCGHGATCGDLDEDQLFYAMARGLPRAQAEALLLEAFAADALDDVADERLREALTEYIRAWLAERGA